MLGAVNSFANAGIKKLLIKKILLRKPDLYTHSSHSVSDNKLWNEKLTEECKYKKSISR